MIHSRRLLTAAALVLAVSTPALAGPPLLCHPFDIGAAPSLPWDGAGGWFQGKSDYPIDRLVADTEAILQPGTPVIVRMETLRRAAIYASRDAAVARTLVDRLSATARAGAKAPDALASLDAAYLIEALHQVTMLGQSGEFRDRVPGVTRALEGRDAAPFLAAALKGRPSDPSVAFAAALIAMGKDKHASNDYAARARAGASADALLARNINHLS
jgi:hypothetical protein